MSRKENRQIWLGTQTDASSIPQLLDLESCLAALGTYDLGGVNALLLDRSRRASDLAATSSVAFEWHNDDDLANSSSKYDQPTDDEYGL
jgi:hypothetical protein